MKFVIHIYKDPANEHGFMASIRTPTPEVELGFGIGDGLINAVANATQAAANPIVKAFELERRTDNDRRAQPTSQDSDVRS